MPAYGDIGLAPPDRVLRFGILDDELVLGRRPVCLPVATTNGPSFDNSPSPFRTASSDQLCRAEITQRPGVFIHAGKQRASEEVGHCASPKNRRAAVAGKTVTSRYHMAYMKCKIVI